MKQRIITGFFFVLAVLLFLIPGYFQPLSLCAFLLIISVAGSFELTRAWYHRGHKIKVYSLILASLALIPPVIIAEIARLYISVEANYTYITWSILSSFIWIAIIGISTFFAYLFKRGLDDLKLAVICFLSQLYLSIPLSLGVVMILFIPRGAIWFYLAILTPWVCDTAAYFVGYFWGNKKWVPELSPKKTFAGFYGGLIGTILLYIIIFNTVFSSLMQDNLVLRYHLIIGGGLINGLLAQLGDLAASTIKRYTGIKDFSNLMPGHGGILDRFDSTFFVLPATFCLALIFTIGG